MRTISITLKYIAKRFNLPEQSLQMVGVSIFYSVH